MNLKSVIWTIVSVLVLVGIINFVGFILPYVLIGGLIIYLVYKAKKYFGSKNNNNNETYTSTYNNAQESYTSAVNDDINGEVIDVDYKEVDK